MFFQSAGTTAQVMVTVIVAPNYVSVKVSGCRTFLKFILEPERATVVRLFNVIVLFPVVEMLSIRLRKINAHNTTSAAKAVHFFRSGAPAREARLRSTMGKKIW